MSFQRQAYAFTLGGNDFPLFHPPSALGDCNAVAASRIERIANAVSSSNGENTNGGVNGVGPDRSLKAVADPPS